MKRILFLLIVLFPVLSFAQALDPIFIPPEWLQQILLNLDKIPVVGPHLVLVLKWLGVISAILTILTTAFLAIVKALSLVLNVAGLAVLASKVEALKEKVFPYLAWLSSYNVQKKK